MHLPWSFTLLGGSDFSDPSDALGVGYIVPRITLPTKLVRSFWLTGNVAFFESLTVGVCNNPDPISVMVRAKFGSWYTVPLRIIPERGYVPENSLKPFP